MWGISIATACVSGNWMAASYATAGLLTMLTYKSWHSLSQNERGQARREKE
jgi:hypothetical protein